MNIIYDKLHVVEDYQGRLYLIMVQLMAMASFGDIF